MWLLFFMCPYVAKGNHTCLNDTIILGGKKLIVQHELTYDTLDVEEPKKPNTKKNRIDFGDWKAGFEGIGYIPLDVLQAKQTGFSSINAFTGPDRRSGNGMGIAVTGEKAIGKAGWNLSSGLGVDFFTGSNLIFDAEELDDSLVYFATFDKNDLRQILEFRFDIGSETDTVALALTQDPFRSTWLRIPLGLTFEREINRELDFRISIFADMRFNISGQKPDVILIETAGPQVLEVKEGMDWDYRSFAVTPRLSVGGMYAMDRRWHLIGGVNFAFPFEPIDSDNPWMEYSSILIDLRLGVSYVIGK